MCQLFQTISPFPFFMFSFGWSCFDIHTWTVLYVFVLYIEFSFSFQTLDPYDRPWASTPTKIAKNTPSEEKLTKPAKGTRAAP